MIRCSTHPFLTYFNGVSDPHPIFLKIETMTSHQEKMITFIIWYHRNRPRAYLKREPVRCFAHNSALTQTLEPAADLGRFNPVARPPQAAPSPKP